MWKRLKTDFLKECTSVAQSNTLESEITKYFVITANDDDPLMWWKKNQHIFPHLSHLAKLFLGIPSTSAPSQRLFTVAGTLTTARRSDLHPLSAKQALFIHDNWHLTSEMDTRGKLQNVVVSS